MERDTPFETPWASNQLPNPRICPPWWLGRHTTKSPRHSARYSPDARYGEKRGPHIDRHPMGLCRCFLSQIVGGHTDDDIRHCGGPIGSKRRQKRRSHVFFLCDVVFGKVGGVKLRASIMSVSFGCRCRRCAPAASRPRAGRESIDADQRVR